MSYEPVWTAASWTNRLPAVAGWLRKRAVVGVLVAALVGFIGTVHVLLAPESHLQVSLLAVLVVLWSITTLVAVGGAYASLAGYLRAGQRDALELLPVDERRVLEPIVDSPGITQVEVVARSDYSDAKVSQTLKALRERGLVYRESQGRTYRLYPGTALE